CSTLLKIAAFFFVVKFIVLLLATGVAMILFAQGLQMVTFALFIPASVYYVNERMDSENKVKGQALMTAAYIGVSGTIGDFAGGQMIDKLGVQAMLQAGVALSILGLALIVIGAKDTADLRVSKALKAEGSCCHE
ncbi:MAG: MFS transporter, partial [Clostridia bacterium]|nr:MFS transporter [Clostridia bacterium]